MRQGEREPDRMRVCVCMCVYVVHNATGKNSWISAVSHHFVGLIPCFSWRNRHFSCIHYTGACTSHPHKVKSTSTSGPSDVMMSEVLCIEVTQFFFCSFFFCLSQQLLRQSGKSDVWRWGRWVWTRVYIQTQWPVENTTLEHAFRKSDLMGAFVLIWKNYLCPLIWAKLCWLWGINNEGFLHESGQKHDLSKPKNVPKTPPLLTRQTSDSSDGIWYGAQRPVAPNSAPAGRLLELGGAGSGARESPRPPPNRASCLRAMQLFLHCVQYQLESNANYLRRAFQGSQL